MPHVHIRRIAPKTLTRHRAFLHLLRQWDACEPGYLWVRERKVTAAQAWHRAPGAWLRWMLDQLFVSHMGYERNHVPLTRLISKVVRARAKARQEGTSETQATREAAPWSKVKKYFPQDVV